MEAQPGVTLITPPGASNMEPDLRTTIPTDFVQIHELQLLTFQCMSAGTVDVFNG